MSSIHKRNLGYIPSLDGLRAIAILLVMLLHSHFYLGKNGQIGVSIFFTLSGFLITTLLLEEFANKNRISFLGFYIRRTMRLFPALYTMLLFLLCYSFLFQKNELFNTTYKEILSAALYVYNISWKWGWGNSNLYLGQTWSLAVEEQFYLIWPWFLFFAIKRNKLKILQYLLVTFILLSWTLKSTEFYPEIVKSIIKEPIFIGCLGAILRWNYGEIKLPRFLAVFSIFLILLIGVFPINIPFNPFDISAVLSIIIILDIVNYSKNNTILNFLSFKPFIFIGKISYSLYLWHLIVFRLFSFQYTLPASINFISKFLVTFFLALGSWYIIEKKATKKGRIWSEKLNLKSNLKDYRDI